MYVRILILPIIILFSFDMTAQNNDTLIIEKIDKYITNSEDITIKYFDDLIEKYPTSNYLIGMRASFQYYNEDKEKAKLDLDKKVKEDSALMNNSFIIMSMALYEGDVQKERLLLEALNGKLSNINKWLRYELYDYYRELNLKKALNFLEEALVIDPSFRHALISKCDHYSQITDCEKIINLLKTKDHINLDYILFWYLGSAYYNCNEINQSEKYYQLSNQKKRNSDALGGLATIEHYEKENYKKAEKLYKEALRINPKHTTSIQGIAWLYFDIKKDKKAEQMLKLLIDYDDDQDAYSSLTMFYLSTSEYKKAKDTNNEAINKFGKNSYNQTYKIISLYLLKEIDDNMLNNEFMKYEKDFGKDEFIWMIELLESFKN